MSAFVVTSETIDDAVSLILPGITCQETLDAVGAAVLAVNAEAVAQRYNEPDRSTGARYRYSEPDSDPYQRLKSLDCLIYQCSEGNVDKTPFCHMLESVRDDWTVIMCPDPDPFEAKYDHPAYKAADWNRGR